MLFSLWDAKDLQRQPEIKVLRFLRYITRHPVRSPQIPDPVGGTVPIPLINGDASDYASIYAVLKCVRPDVVLVSEERAEDELKVINAIGTNVARLIHEKDDDGSVFGTPPLLLVSGDTGKPHLARYFNRALRYYSSLWSPAGSHQAAATNAAPLTRVRYPSPFMPPPRPFSSYGDPIIDVLDDPAERLVGIIRAYLDPRKSVPVELNFCDPDTPGMMASNLAALAGYEPAPEKHPSKRPHLSIANTRLIARPGNRFIVKGYAYLNPDAAASEAGSAQSTFCRLAVVAGHEPQRPSSAAALLFAGTSGKSVPARVIPDVLTLFGDSSPANRPDTFGDQLGYCCGMPNCPIEAFNKVSAGILGVPKSKAGQDDGAFHRLRERYRIGAYKHGDLRDPDNRAFAHFRLTCREECTPGSFATALNALLCTRLTPMTPRPNSVFNLTYIASYECHDERHGIFTCYGRRTQRSRTGRGADVSAGLSEGSVIEQIEIYPIRDASDGSSPWKRYADQVTEFLNGDGDPAEPFRSALTHGYNLAESIVIRKGESHEVSVAVPWSASHATVRFPTRKGLRRDRE